MDSTKIKTVLITGAGGLIGSEAVKFFSEKGDIVKGIDNNLREYFFGKMGDTSRNLKSLISMYPNFKNFNIDLRDRKEVLNFFEKEGPFDLVIHTAAQPSHDWAAKEPFTDFDVNANATLNLLEAFRLNSPKGVFIFTSTNKVYGDNPNFLPLKELETRWEYDFDGDFSGKPELKIGVSKNGINESLSIDNCKHSLFGASKAAADLLCQEYGKYFGLKIGVFRGGCLTGPQHSAVELHGFLSYIIECAIKGTPYKIFGYKGKQVRDQIHSLDVIMLFEEFYKSPRNGEVYNIGGGKENSASIIEIIELLKKEFNFKLNYDYTETNRIGDHICYYTDLTKIKTHFPNWKITKDLRQIIKEIIETKKK